MLPGAVAAIRGAVAPVYNSKEGISAAACRLVEEMLAKNNLSASDLGFVIFSATGDLDAAYPAAGVRQLPGFADVPMLCVQEMAVQGSMARCLRVLAAVSVDKRDIRHVYLDDAVSLRPDWSEGK